MQPVVVLPRQQRIVPDVLCMWCGLRIGQSWIKCRLRLSWMQLLMHFHAIANKIAIKIFCFSCKCNCNAIENLERVLFAIVIELSCNRSKSGHDSKSHWKCNLGMFLKQFHEWFKALFDWNWHATPYVPHDRPALKSKRRCQHLGLVVPVLTRDERTYFGSRFLPPLRCEASRSVLCFEVGENLGKTRFHDEVHFASRKVKNSQSVTSASISVLLKVLVENGQQQPLTSHHDHTTQRAWLIASA